MAKRGPKGPIKTSFKKGQVANPNGRPPGSQNVATKDFKQAVKNLLEENSANIQEWLARVAENNPARALECLGNLAEFAQPRLSRVTHAGDADAPVLFQRITDDLIDRDAPTPDKK